jgi:hypothetical protein
MMRRILDWLRWRAYCIAIDRDPDFVIGGQDNPYLRRWWVIPRNPFLNIYLHEFLRSDDDRALHTHPWAVNCSVLLEGKYIEWVPGNGNPLRPLPKFRRAGDVLFRWGAAAHRIQLYREGEREIPCWTLFLTGPRVRAWGFFCDRGWVHWRDFTSPADAGSIGKGCE